MTPASRLQLTAGVLACGLFLAGVTRVLGNDHFSGTLTWVSEQEVRMSVGDETKLFTVHAATMISLDGKPAPLSDLKSGDRARIMSQPGDDGTHIAVRIDADRDGG